MENKIKVLLVDDETRFCETSSKRLIKRGFDTTIANNAETAIHILKNSPQDVIVLDLKMPGMDGHTALHEIKKIDHYMQVIILTGHGNKYSATRAFVGEVFDYLSKPCDVEILASRICDAYRAKHREFKIDNKKALDIMTCLNELKTIPANSSVKQAMEKMIDCNENSSAWPGDTEDTPRMLVVLDEKNVFAGILTKMDVIRVVMPESALGDRLFNQESTRFSSIFWSGFFQTG